MDIGEDEEVQAKGIHNINKIIAEPVTHGSCL
jgi:hypothetical protein